MRDIAPPHNTNVSAPQPPQLSELGPMANDIERVSGQAVDTVRDPDRCMALPPPR